MDNFEQIKRFLTFYSLDEYYFLQIIVRSKDDKSVGCNNRTIKSYAINSMRYLENHEKEIKKLCDTFGARAYIHLSPRLYSKVALIMMQMLTERISNNQQREVDRIFNSASGTFKPERDRALWIIDVDNKDMRFINSVINFVERECRPIGEKYTTLIETKNGYHIITKPFDLQQFTKQYPNIDVHKNNPTLLYCGV